MRRSSPLDRVPPSAGGHQPAFWEALGRGGSEDPRGPPRELLGVSLISTAERERPRETPIPHLGGASLGH